jgi:allophanate hydrolase
VDRLIAAGALCVGKTNMDQFATGLTGTRSPHGPVRNYFHPRYISGGSSSGSALAVAAGQVTFSLGTDTAGSGRVPAAFNHLVGLKPTRGSLSTRGVVPACRSLDCVSIFTHDVADARMIMDIAAGFDPLDPFSRDAGSSAPPHGGPFRFGVPRPDQLEFFGNSEAAALYEAALWRLASLGGQRIEIDFTPFEQTAALLYGGPWVAERYAAIEAVVRKQPAAMEPTVRQIISGGAQHSAVDAFRAMYRLAELRRAADEQMEHVDVLALPTTGTIYRIDEVQGNPIALNTNLGRYTNFMNLLDMAGLAVPMGFLSAGVPMGVTLCGPAWSEPMLLSIGQRYQEDLSRAVVVPAPVRLEAAAKVKVAVVGAHLSGMPLHWQLEQRGARLVASSQTAPVYRFYALAASKPPKPALIHVGEGGASIVVEVYEMGEAEFGSFVALVPPPLAIGTVELADGTSVRGFVAEPRAMNGATDITHFGSWRAYIASLASTA